MPGHFFVRLCDLHIANVAFVFRLLWLLLEVFVLFPVLQTTSYQGEVTPFELAVLAVLSTFPPVKTDYAAS